MKTLLHKLSVAVVAGVMLLTSSAFAADNAAADIDDDRITLSIGLYTTSKPSTVVKKFRPIVSLLESRVSAKLGKSVRIRMQIAKNYQKGVEYLANGKVDFARFGPATYVEAKTENPNIQILAVESKNGTKVVNGIIATGLHSSIRKLSDLKGQSFAFGDMQSSSGRYMAQQFLLRNGISAKDLSRYEYLGRHDVVGTKVSVGNFAAGAMSEATFRLLLSEGEKIRELARFPLVSKPWVARAGIDPAIYSALKISLLELSNSDAMLPLDFNGFLESTNADFRVIAESMSQNHRFFSDENKKSTEWVLAGRKENSNSK